MTSNKAVSYGVTVQPVATNQKRWVAEFVEHLLPDENRGRHSVFVDVEDGVRVRDPNLRIGWTWEGRQPNQDAPPKPLDKPDTDLAHGNLDIYPQQTLTVWITGDGLPSDRVSGIHTRHPDERGPKGELWNSYGHHSFFVRFVRTPADAAEPQPEPTDPSDSTVNQRLDALEADVKALRALLRQWTGD